LKLDMPSNTPRGGKHKVVYEIHGDMLDGRHHIIGKSKKNKKNQQDLTHSARNADTARLPAPAQSQAASSKANNNSGNAYSQVQSSQQQYSAPQNNGYNNSVKANNNSYSQNYKPADQAYSNQNAQYGPLTYNQYRASASNKAASNSNSNSYVNNTNSSYKPVNNVNTNSSFKPTNNTVNVNSSYKPTNNTVNANSNYKPSNNASYQPVQNNEQKYSNKAGKKNKASQSMNTNQANSSASLPQKKMKANSQQLAMVPYIAPEQFFAMPQGAHANVSASTKSKASKKIIARAAASADASKSANNHVFVAGKTGGVMAVTNKPASKSAGTNEVVSVRKAQTFATSRKVQAPQQPSLSKSANAVNTKNMANQRSSKNAGNQTLNGNSSKNSNNNVNSNWNNWSAASSSNTNNFKNNADLQAHDWGRNNTQWGNWNDWNDNQSWNRKSDNMNKSNANKSSKNTNAGNKKSQVNKSFKMQKSVRSVKSMPTTSRKADSLGPRPSLALFRQRKGDPSYPHFNWYGSLFALKKEAVKARKAGMKVARSGLTYQVSVDPWNKFFPNYMDRSGKQLSKEMKMLRMNMPAAITMKNNTKNEVDNFVSVSPWDPQFDVMVKKATLLALSDRSVYMPMKLDAAGTFVTYSPFDERFPTQFSVYGDGKTYNAAQAKAFEKNIRQQIASQKSREQMKSSKAKASLKGSVSNNKMNSNVKNSSRNANNSSVYSQQDARSTMQKSNKNNSPGNISGSMNKSTSKGSVKNGSNNMTAVNASNNKASKGNSSQSSARSNNANAFAKNNNSPSMKNNQMNVNSTNNSSKKSQRNSQNKSNKGNNSGSMKGMSPTMQQIMTSMKPGGSLPLAQPTLQYDPSMQGTGYHYHPFPRLSPYNSGNSQYYPQSPRNNRFGMNQNKQWGMNSNYKLQTVGSNNGNWNWASY